MSATEGDGFIIDELVAYFEAKNSAFDAKKSKSDKKKKKEKRHKNKKAKCHENSAEKQHENNVEVKPLQAAFKKKSVNSVSASASKYLFKNDILKRDHESSLEGVTKKALKNISTLTSSSSSSSSSIFGFNSPKVAKKDSNVLNVLQYGKPNKKHKRTDGVTEKIFKGKVKRQKIDKTLKQNEIYYTEKKKRYQDVLEGKLVNEQRLEQKKSEDIDFTALKHLSADMGAMLKKENTKKERIKRKANANDSSNASSTECLPRKRGRPRKKSPINPSLSTQNFFNQPIRPIQPSKIINPTWQPSKSTVNKKLLENAIMQNESLVTKPRNETFVQNMNRNELDKMNTINRRESMLKENSLIILNELNSNANLVQSKSYSKSQKKVVHPKDDVKAAERRIYNKNLATATTVKQPPTTSKSPQYENIASLCSGGMVSEHTKKQSEYILKEENSPVNFLQTNLNINSDLLVDTKSKSQNNKSLPKIWDSPETNNANLQNNGQEFNDSFQTENIATLCANMISGEESSPLYSPKKSCIYNRIIASESTPKQSKVRDVAAISMTPQMENIPPIWSNEISEVQQHQKYEKNDVTIISNILLSRPYTTIPQKPVDWLKSNVTLGVESPLYQKAAPSIHNKLELAQAKDSAESQFSLKENPEVNFLQRKYNMNSDLSINTKSPSNTETNIILPKIWDSPEISNTKSQKNSASPVYANDSDSDSDSGIQDKNISLINFYIEQPEEPIKITEDLFQDENVIKILHAWVQTTPVPDDDDIDKLSNGVCKLVKLKLDDKLYNGMLYLCRFINTYRNSTQFCYWHCSYKMIVACIRVQLWEQNVYKSFCLGDEIQCKECKL